MSSGEILNPRELAKKSRQIDAQLKADFKRAQEDEKKWKKIVLLGSSDSGKTTLLKQVKILYGTGFTSEELQMYKRAASDNVYDSMNSLICGMRLLKLTPDENDIDVLAAITLFEEEIREKGDILSSAIVQAISEIWYHDSAQAAFKRRNEFLIQDTADFFIRNAERLTADSYVPSQDDVLLIRIMTTSISTTRLQVNNTGMDFVDVGGHRSFRFRWAPYLNESITCIFFVMSLASYDQQLAEDHTVKRMDDAVQLFAAIIKNKLLRGIMMIVFLNKVDLFEEKIKISPIEKHYPKFKSNPKLLEAGTAFFKKSFESDEDDRSIFHYVTKATDTALMKTILAAVTTAVVQSLLKSSGLS